MNNIEVAIIGVFLGSVCPLLCFVLFWWTAAVFHLYKYNIPESAIMMVSVSGFLVGILLDSIFIKRWVKGFYTVNISLLMLVYLALSFVAIGFFMGLPLGTFMLGILVAVYMGRRQYHMKTVTNSAAKSISDVSFFAAFVTSFTALPIGILVLKEESIVKIFRVFYPFSKNSLEGYINPAIIVFLCVMLFFIQYWCSRKTGLLVFRISNKYI